MNKETMLSENDYVLFDKANNNLYSDPYGRVVLFGIKEEAEEDCYGNESVVRCTDLPIDLQELILNQMKI
jgi:hypothetical protein